MEYTESARQGFTEPFEVNPGPEQAGTASITLLERSVYVFAARRQA